MKLSALKVDTARAEQGDWIDNIPEMGDLRLKVRGFGNRDYAAFVAKELAAVPRDKRESAQVGSPPKAAIREAILARAMLETILLDWDGLTADDDQPLPYSKDKATELLLDPDFRPFRDAVAWAARAVEEAAADKVEAVAGNSARASDGTSDGALKPST